MIYKCFLRHEERMIVSYKGAKIWQNVVLRKLLWDSLFLASYLYNAANQEKQSSGNKAGNKYPASFLD
jgi:hypothetical protein